MQDFEERLANGRSIVTGQPWTEYFPVGEVWNDGRALIARLRTEHPRIWENMVLTVDSLLWNKWMMSKTHRPPSAPGCSTPVGRGWTARSNAEVSRPAG